MVPLEIGELYIMPRQDRVCQGRMKIATVRPLSVKEKWCINAEPQIKRSTACAYKILRDCIMALPSVNFLNQKLAVSPVFRMVSL